MRSKVRNQNQTRDQDFLLGHCGNSASLNIKRVTSNVSQTCHKWKNNTKLSNSLNMQHCSRIIWVASLIVFILPNRVIDEPKISTCFIRFLQKETKSLLEKKAFMTAVTNIIIIEHCVSYLKHTKTTKKLFWLYYSIEITLLNTQVFWSLGLIWHIALISKASRIPIKQPLCTL